MSSNEREEEGQLFCIHRYFETTGVADVRNELYSSPTLYDNFFFFLPPPLLECLPKLF